MIKPLCSFCRKPENHVLVLIKSQIDAWICNECVAACVRIIRSQTDSEAP